MAMAQMSTNGKSGSGRFQAAPKSPEAEAVDAEAAAQAGDMILGIPANTIFYVAVGVIALFWFTMGGGRKAKVTDVSLAISLHAPTDELRDQLVPLNRKYPIAELLAACRHYLDVLGERRSLTIEYTLLQGVNDDISHARELARLLKDLKCKINLIPFNPFPASGYQRPTEGSVRDFQTHLINAGYPTMLRTTRGDDINAACGQLVGQVEDRTKRQERYLARVKAQEVA